MEYISQVLERVKARNANEPEFIQTIEEVFGSLGPVFEQHPEWVEANILERIAEPERTIMFKVPWTDDNGKIQVNRGYRVQFNGAIGPFKGGIRFAPNVYIGTMKFLGFEQIFKNALTGLPIGGGKGGSDFDPTGKSDGELMRFCQSFMNELYRHIGPDVDVPAGDIGVGKREVGYMYGQYRRLVGKFENGVFTGKGLSYGGCATRPPATGWGIAYFANEVMKHEGTDLKGKTVSVSGFGNVAWGTCMKLAELGAIPVTLSGPDGYIYDKDGVITQEKIDYLVEMRESRRNKVQDYADKFGVEFFPGEKPWNVKVDIAMPCAMQNDVHLEHAKQLVANGVKYMIEGANMPCTNEAVEYMQEQGMIVGPSKACNAGGVATSALEMSMNSMRYNWTDEEVDEKLHQIMINIHANAAKAAKDCGFGYDLVKGANIAGFLRVAEAMYEQGDY